MKSPCPCCGNLTLEHAAGYDICPVCFWEDDGVTDLEQYSGPNHMRLSEAKANFARYGAMCDRFIQHVRAPLPEEMPGSAAIGEVPVIL